jgi:hypothetical protein
MQIQHRDDTSSPPIQPERRVHRLPLPPCQRCLSAHTAVVCRTSCVIYVRCAYCREVWSLEKPGHDSGNS